MTRQDERLDGEPWGLPVSSWSSVPILVRRRHDGHAIGVRHTERNRSPARREFPEFVYVNKTSETARRRGQSRPGRPCPRQYPTARPGHNAGGHRAVHEHIVSSADQPTNRSAARVGGEDVFPGSCHPTVGCLSHAVTDVNAPFRKSPAWLECANVTTAVPSGYTEKPNGVSVFSRRGHGGGQPASRPHRQAGRRRRCPIRSDLQRHQHVSVCPTPTCAVLPLRGGPPPANSSEVVPSLHADVVPMKRK